jgi:hypothetical protein
LPPGQRWAVLGYSFSLAEGWTSPAGSSQPVAHTITEADTIHALLVLRADALEGCAEGSPEEAELASIADAIEKYEAKCWPNGKEPGGKG